MKNLFSIIIIVLCLSACIEEEQNKEFKNSYLESCYSQIDTYLNTTDYNINDVQDTQFYTDIEKITYQVTAIHITQHNERITFYFNYNTLLAVEYTDSYFLITYDMQSDYYEVSDI